VTGGTLRFEGVSFAYRSHGPLRRTQTVVFESFSWQVPAGRTVLLGPNGAGKTTLMALGATALDPTSGRIEYGEAGAGWHSDRLTLRRKVGWMPQRVTPIPGLTAREDVAYAGWLKGMPRSEAWQSALPALATVDLTDEADRLAAQLSGGQMRRLGLARLLIHRADLLLLDEPTAGLDPSQRARFRQTMADLGVDTPLVVSTHQVDDLDGQFDAVVVLDRGSIRFAGPVDAFLRSAPAGSVRPAEAAYASLVSGE